MPSIFDGTYHNPSRSQMNAAAYNGCVLHNDSSTASQSQNRYEAAVPVRDLPRARSTNSTQIYNQSVLHDDSSRESRSRNTYSTARLSTESRRSTDSDYGQNLREHDDFGSATSSHRGKPFMSPYVPIDKSHSANLSQIERLLASQKLPYDPYLSQHESQAYERLSLEECKSHIAGNIPEGHEVVMQDGLGIPIASSGIFPTPRQRRGSGRTTRQDTNTGGPVPHSGRHAGIPCRLRAKTSQSPAGFQQLKEQGFSDC